MKAMGSFKNNTKSSILSREIAEFHNRGFASAEKVQTVLNMIRNETEIKHLKNLDESKVQEIAQIIAEKVQEQDITGKTGATYISALNQVVDYVNFHFDKEISELRYSDFDIHKSTDYSDKSISSEIHQSFQNFLEQKFEQVKDEKYQALQHAVELQREFGLRFRESAGLNEKTIEKALEINKLELSREDWTKNARERSIEIRTESQKELLEAVRDYLKENNTVNLAGADNYKDYNSIASFRNFADQIRKDFSSQTGQNFNFHGERHHWAQEKFSNMWQERTGTKMQAPIKYYSEQLQANGWTGEGKFYNAVAENNIKNWFEYAKKETGLNIQEIKEIDKEIRQEISKELGHSRLDITNTYLGHI